MIKVNLLSLQFPSIRLDKVKLYSIIFFGASLSSADLLLLSPATSGFFSLLAEGYLCRPFQLAPKGQNLPLFPRNC
jgi:hypothetical protein